MAGFGNRHAHSGKRKDARLRVRSDARLETVARTASVRLNDLSRTGASVTSEFELKRGMDVFLHWRDIHAFGTVVRVDGKTCGLRFDEPLTDEQVQQVRLLPENSLSLEIAELIAAARNSADETLSLGSGD